MILRRLRILFIISVLSVGTGGRTRMSFNQIGQREFKKTEWILNTASGVPFWIALNQITPRHLVSFREMFIFVKPEDFSEENLRKVFLYLSAEFQLPETLIITARSDREKLQLLADYHRALNSISTDDHSTRRAIQGNLEEASVLARSGCYRADYGRSETDERFYYYPDPNKKNGYPVVLKRGRSKFKPTGNAVADLMRAAKLGLTSYVRMFLDQGTDVNVRDQYGYTPLFTASLWRQRNVVDLLLDRGAQVDMKGPNGWTPLMCVLSLSRLHDTGLAEELLRWGADVNAKGDDGETVLTLATKKGQRNIVEELLRRGANVDAKDASGKTALMIAEENHLNEISSLLRKAGALK